MHFIWPGNDYQSLDVKHAFRNSQLWHLFFIAPLFKHFNWSYFYHIDNILSVQVCVVWNWCSTFRSSSINSIDTSPVWPPPPDIVQHATNVLDRPTFIVWPGLWFDVQSHTYLYNFILVCLIIMTDCSAVRVMLTLAIYLKNSYTEISSEFVIDRVCSRPQKTIDKISDFK